MKQFTIAMTCSGGTGIAGDYIADTKRKALTMAKKEHGDEWTYYVHKEKNIDMNKRHFFVAHYWNDDDNRLGAYTYHNEIQYGTEADALNFLKYVQRPENGGDHDWQIFWINTDRDDRKTPESIRAYIEAKGKELERLKETDYAAWLDLKNDC